MCQSQNSYNLLSQPFILKNSCVLVYLPNFKSFLKILKVWENDKLSFTISPAIVPTENFKGG
jgi:hypothetical protein